MYKLEMKRLLKSKANIFLAAAALGFSVFMALSSINSVIYYVSFTYGENESSVTALTGFEAVASQRERMSKFEGWLTPERIAELAALSEAETANGIYDSGVEYVLSSLRRAGADDLSDYYAARKNLIERAVSRKYGDGVAQTALKIDEGTTNPFYYEYGHGDSNAIVNLSLCQTAIAAVCAAISSASFVQGYATNADDIMRCAKHGRMRFARVKMLASLSYSAALYILCTGVFTAIIFAVFGSDASAAQLKGLYDSPLILLGMTENGEYFLTVLMGLLTTLAVSAFALMVSSMVKSPVAAAAVSVVMVFLPLVCTALLERHSWGLWLQNILPSGGVSITRGLMYQLTMADFLTIGSLALWTPFVMLAAPVIETPVFAMLARRAYVRHENK